MTFTTRAENTRHWAGKAHWLFNHSLNEHLKRQFSAFVDYDNNERYHASLNNVTPAGPYFGRDKAIIRKRAKIKNLTIEKCRLQHQKQAA